MNIMNKFVFSVFQYLLLSILISSSFWTYAFQYLSFPRQKKNNEVLSTSFESRAYYSFSNFNGQGLPEYLKDQGWVSFIDYHLSVSYSPTQWFYMSPYIEGQTHMIKNKQNTTVLPFSPTLSGLKIFTPLRISYFSILPEIDFTYPLDVQRPISRVITNDGVPSVTPFLALSFDKWHIQPFVRLGYRWRHFKFSHLLLVQAGLLYRDQGLEIGLLTGGLRGVTSDVDSNSLNRHKDLKQYNNGSLKFYSVLPTSVGTSLWFDAPITTRFNFLAQVQFNWMGFNYAHGYTFHLGLQYHFFRRSKSEEKYKKSLHHFKQKSTDSSYF